MGAPAFPYPHRCPQPPGALRIHLAPEGTHGDIGGVWWPYGHDLTREAPHLVNNFPDGQVERLVYAAEDWDVVAEEVFTRFGRIKAGFFPHGHVGGLVLLRLRGPSLLRLRVLWQPPPTRYSGFPAGVTRPR